MSHAYLIQNGRIIDPASGRDEVGELFVADGKVAEPPDTLPPGTVGIDATGRVVAPGFIDIHVHLREPGGEEAETVLTGAQSAARGGFTTIVAMPNTIPALDSPDLVRYVTDPETSGGFCRVLTTACITKGREGRDVSDMSDLSDAGAVAFTDDGATVQDDDVMRQAMQRSRELGLPVMDHAQDREIELQGGVMHEGEVSLKFGFPGIPVIAETRIVERDIRLAAETGCHVHIQHVSSAEGVELIRRAREEGLPVTGEATPHHLALCDEDIDPDNANFKMNPPLRSRTDREALRRAVATGVLDVLATDHAPHHADKKARGFLDGPFGLVGLETAVGVTYSELVSTGLLSLQEWIARWTSGPARALGLPIPGLAVGSPADVVVLDLDEAWVVAADSFASRSRNTPFEGRRVVGRAVHTICNGQQTWGEG